MNIKSEKLTFILETIALYNLTILLKSIFVLELNRGNGILTSLDIAKKLCELQGIVLEEKDMKYLSRTVSTRISYLVSTGFVKKLSTLNDDRSVNYVCSFKVVDKLVMEKANKNLDLFKNVEVPKKEDEWKTGRINMSMIPSQTASLTLLTFYDSLKVKVIREEIIKIFRSNSKGNKKSFSVSDVCYLLAKKYKVVLDNNDFQIFVRKIAPTLSNMSKIGSISKLKEPKLPNFCKKLNYGLTVEHFSLNEFKDYSEESKLFKEISKEIRHLSDNELRLLKKSISDLVKNKQKEKKPLI